MSNKNSFFLQNISERILKVRQAKGYTIEKMKEETGFSDASVKNYEKGRRFSPGEYLFTLVHDLKVNPLYLFFGQEPIFYEGDLALDADKEIHRFKKLIEYQDKEIEELKKRIRDLES